MASIVSYHCTHVRQLWKCTTCCCLSHSLLFAHSLSLSPSSWISYTAHFCMYMYMYVYCNSWNVITLMCCSYCGCNPLHYHALALLGTYCIFTYKRVSPPPSTLTVQHATVTCNFIIFLLCWRCHTAVPPPPPTNLRVVETTGSSITVMWTAPIYHGNLTYRVYTSFDNRPRAELMNAMISGTRATLPSEWCHVFCGV